MTAFDWSIDGWIILTGILSACSCALLGNYLVLRRMSLMGDAISHAVLPGLAIAFLLSESRSPMPMFLGAVVAGGLTAALSEAVATHGKVEHGAAMGVIFSILFAAGLILIRQAADHVDLDPGCVLYGNISQIPLDAIGGEIPPAARNIAIVLGMNALFVTLFYKELKLSSFDPQLSSALGIPAGVMHYALMILVSITTVANFEAVGSILVIAMLIVPAAAAHLLTDRLGIMIGLSLLLAALSAVAGHWLAAFAPAAMGWTISANTSAMMAVVAGFLLFLAVLFAPRHGLLSRLRHRLALGASIVREDILGLLHRWHELQPDRGRPMRRDELLSAVGDSFTARIGLRSLLRRREIETERGANGGPPGLRLSPSGRARSAGLIRSHRLWEVYLAKHFALPLDHLHASAERTEHYLTPQLRAELAADLDKPGVDPHGKRIPQE